MLIVAKRPKLSLVAPLVTRKLKPSKTQRLLLSPRRPTARTRTSDVVRESLVARQPPLSAQPHLKIKSARK